MLVTMVGMVVVKVDVTVAEMVVVEMGKIAQVASTGMRDKARIMAHVDTNTERGETMALMMGHRKRHSIRKEEDLTRAMGETSGKGEVLVITRDRQEATIGMARRAQEVRMTIKGAEFWEVTILIN